MTICDEVFLGTKDFFFGRIDVNYDILHASKRRFRDANHGAGADIVGHPDVG
jgi:hypothetical protein